MKRSPFQEILIISIQKSSKALLVEYFPPKKKSLLKYVSQKTESVLKQFGKISLSEVYFERKYKFPLYKTRYGESTQNTNQEAPAYAMIGNFEMYII